MNWETLQQFIRIAMYSGGAFFLGESVADSEMYQAAIAGAVSIAAFLWWLYWERNRDGS